jgi:hypothetical protein
LRLRCLGLERGVVDESSGVRGLGELAKSR